MWIKNCCHHGDFASWLIAISLGFLILYSSLFNFCILLRIRKISRRGKPLTNRKAKIILFPFRKIDLLAASYRINFKNVFVLFLVGIFLMLPGLVPAYEYFFLPRERIEGSVTKKGISSCNSPACALKKMQNRPARIEINGSPYYVCPEIYHYLNEGNQVEAAVFGIGKYKTIEKIKR